LKIQRIDATHVTTRPGDYPVVRLPEVAFLGRSNVGKSSLINSLVNRKKLARTSKDPGRTRAIHWYRLDGSGKSCFLVDLPGYGYARVSRRVREEEWAELIETYLESERPLVLAIQLLDIRRDGPTDLDWQMIEWLRRRETPTAYVLTKADKLKRGKRAQAVAKFGRELGLPPSGPPIPYSAVTGDGRQQLWSIIDRCIAAPV
jgi:GTP-binding protein